MLSVSLNDLPLISVIIPVYNNEEFLRECINSVLVQTYQNLEIILIDDGSTDASGKICDEYAQRDSRIQVIHQKNAGVSAARNAGLQIARGAYIGFVDGDDYIDPDMFSCLFDLCRTSGTEIAVCGVYNKSGDIKFHGEVLDSPRALVRLAGRLYVWNKLFSRRVIKDITFRTDFLYCEDLFFCLEAFAHTDRVACTPHRKYYYRINPHSATKQAFCLKKLNYFDSADAAKAFARQHNMSAFERCIRAEEAANAVSFLADLISYDCPDKAQINAELLGRVRRNIWPLLGGGRSMGNKLFGLASCINFKLACWVYNLIKEYVK